MALGSSRGRTVLAATGRRLRYVLASLLLVLTVVVGTGQPAAAAGESRDLVFLVDGSGSISSADWQIQKDGLSAAIQDATSFPRDGSIAVAVIQWSFVSSAQRTRVEVPLTVLDSQATAESVVGQIQAMSQLGQLTNPGDGIRAGTNLLLADGEDPATTDWTLCMSSDGITNSGEALASAASFASASGVDRFSVVGIEDPPNFDETALSNHYSPHVFGGGTVTIARNSAEFATIVTGSCLSDPVELRALEVNQSIQDWGNSVPVVTDKPTAVRAFVQVPAGEDDQRVVGRLFGTRGGAELPGSPLVAINPSSAIIAEEDIESRRDDLQASLNFRLPFSWRNGTVTLRFDAGGAPVDCQEPAGVGGDAANDCTATVTFQDEVTPEIVFVGVEYEDGGTDFVPTTSELFEQVFRFRSILPIADIDYRLDTLGDYTAEPDLDDINRDLAAKRLIDIFFCIFGCTDPTTSNARYYGVLAGDGGGKANGIPGEVSSGFLDGGGARSDTGYARNRGPHELAHTLGRHHAVDPSLPLNGDGNQVGRCNEVASPSAPGHSPFETVGTNIRPTLGPLGSGVDEEIWGLDNRMLFSDPNGLAVIDPRVTFELMSYCGGGPQGRWISEFTYNGLMGGFPASGVGADTGAGDEFVLVSGTIDFEDNSVDLKPALEFIGDPPATDSGDYRVQLLDDNGVELAGADFEPIRMDADAVGPETATGPPTGLVLVPLPKPDVPIGSIEILNNGSVIGTASASANAPTATISSPQGGDTLSDPTVTFQWAGSDADNDPLTYTVLYSADDGNTWDTLIVNSPATELTVQRSDLPASPTARLRVIVSDGVNSTSTTSDQFAVGNNGPLVGIDEPADGSVYSGVQTVDLRGAGYDSEDGPLTGGSLVWTSDLDGVLGTGADLTVNASDLTEGTHQVTLTGTDAAGAVAAETVSIQVFRVGPPTGPGPDVLTCGDASGTVAELEALGFNVIVGTDDRDTIHGTAGNDVILAGGGNDHVFGRAGDDRICLGDGDDRGSGSDGDDMIIGGPGDDRLDGGNGDDLIRGEAGSDQIRGQSGSDTVFGGDGPDHILGGSHDDELNGGDGADVIRGYGGSDIINGDGENDELVGGPGADEINGGEGDDLLVGESGDDFLDGGPGDDRLSDGSGFDTCVNGVETTGCEA